MSDERSREEQEPMKRSHRLGLLGGMSWQSTAVYYRLLNESVGARLGGHASAPVTVHSVEFGEIEQFQRAGDWPAQGRILAEAAAGLQRSGVEAIALGTNTLHLVAEQITDAITVPFIDLIDVVARAVQDYDSIGLLATGYTMTSDLYPKRLATYGTDVVVPDEADRALVHDVIYRELVRGVITDESRDRYREVMARLVDRGAQAVVLACTEIDLLVTADDASVPVLDTTALHCGVLTDFMLTGELP
jgi:aspartate racemase